MVNSGAFVANLSRFRAGKHTRKEVLWAHSFMERRSNRNESQRCWEGGEEEALLVISDRPACRERILEYKKRWKVESTFEDMKSRGWDWEESHVRRLDRVDRMLLVLFLLLWWLAHLAASCIHHGRRDRYDRHDRRDKNIFRIGRLYLLDIERRARRSGKNGQLKNCLLFRGKPGQWLFSLRF